MSCQKVNSQFLSLLFRSPLDIPVLVIDINCGYNSFSLHWKMLFGTEKVWNEILKSLIWISLRKYWVDL